MSIKTFSKKLGFEIETVDSRNYKSKPMREKLITVIEKEINLLNSRDDLKLQRIDKNIDGKVTSVKEVRFWKENRDNPEYVYVCIRFKNKIFGFGETTDRYKPTYFKCLNDKDSVLNMLSGIKDSFIEMEDNDEIFKQTPKQLING